MLAHLGGNGMHTMFMFALIVLVIVCAHFFGKTSERKGYGYPVGFAVCLFGSFLGMLVIWLLPNRNEAK